MKTTTPSKLRRIEDRCQYWMRRRHEATTVRELEHAAEMERLAARLLAQAVPS